MKNQILFARFSLAGLKRFIALITVFALFSNAVFAATFTVNDSGDAADAAAGNGSCATAGAVCTLRAAIEEANALAGTDIINFTAANRTLTPASTMTLSSQIAITGPNVQVNQIDINGGGGAYNGFTLDSNADNSSISGLMIRNFASNGISISDGADDVTIGGTTDDKINVFGLQTDFSTVSANGKGINVAAKRTIIQKNYIVGSTTKGINIAPTAKDIKIIGNHIGIDPMNADKGNGEDGIFVVDGTALDGGDGGVEGLVIGSGVAGEGNTISGNNGSGISIGSDVGGDITGTVKVQGNTIGLGDDGSVVPNSEDGFQTEANTPAVNITFGTDGDGANAATEGNYVGSNGASGADIANGNNVVVAGNKIGINSAGTARGNTGSGLTIGGSTEGPTTVTIGSDSADTNEINTISNNGAGIILKNATTTAIAGNYIGLNASGAGSHGNTGNGISVGNGAGTQINTLTIGGNGTSEAARNFIANSTGGGNGALEIVTTANGATVNIRSTIIGLTENLLTAAANNNTAGMYLLAAANYVIGTNGDGSNDSTEYNVVANGTGNGIYVGNGALTATISGNIIGLASNDDGATFTSWAPNGTAAAAGNKNGIRISSNSLTALTIGGALAAQRNVIGNNPENGIKITDAGNAIAYTIQNNYVGIASNGTTSASNSDKGIDLDDGGAITLTDNVVSNNAVNAVDISAGTSLVARGNKIGTTATGLIAAGNTGIGILISSAAMASVIIGGSIAGQGNVISGQITGYGVFIQTLAATTSPVSFLGNYIGVGVDGTTTTNMDNDSYGIRAETGAITVGGDNDLANSLLAGGNVISNNGDTGVYLTDNVSSAAIYGNIIGLKKDGGGVYNTAAGNAGDGFEIDNGVATSILIGAANGTTVASRRNIISSNGGVGGNEYGISIETPGPGPSGANPIKIKNNYIGTDITGAVARPNYNSGISIELGENVFIGSELDWVNDADEGNLISGNGSAADGIQPGAGITLTGTIDTIGIYGNTIGMNAAKTAALANQAGGININNLASDTTITIGSTATGGRNYISGNAEAVGTSGKGGIQVGSANAVGTVLNIVGNYIGTNGNGDAAVPNDGGGIKISDTSSRVATTVGNGTTAGRNLISGNIDAAMDITGGNITINNNLIGVAANGTTALANGDEGQIYAENAIGTSNISYLKISNNVINNLTTVGAMLINIISWNESNSYLELDNSWLSRINATTATYNYWSRLVGATLTAYAPKVCYDYLDNDNDGIADWSTGLHDIGCENPQDNNEFNDAGGGGGGGGGSSSSSSSSAAASGASAGTAQTGDTSATDSNAGQAEADSTDKSNESSGVPPGAVGSDEDEGDDSSGDSGSESSADAVEQSKIDRSLLENQNVRRYIVSEKLAEAVNTVGDLVTGKDRVNLEILLSDAAEEVAKVDQIQVVLTDDQQVLSDAAQQVARGEDLSEQQVARVERTFEAVVTQSVQRLLEEKEAMVAASGTESGGGAGRDEVGGGGSGTGDGSGRGDQGAGAGDAAGRAAAVIPVRAANGRMIDIDRETQVQFVMDGKKAADLQEIASARGEKKVYLTSYTPVGESDVSAMLEISEGGQVGDPDAGQKIFLGGLRGLSAKSVRDLQPEKPSFTNLIEGVELAQKSVIYVAGPKPGAEVTVFVIDKADSIDPNDWKIWEIGTYELDETGKVAVELDFTDKMAGDIKNFELLVQDKDGEGSVREIIVNKAVEVMIDSVMLRDGKEVIPANLASEGDFTKNLRTSVMLAAETLKQERTQDDRMVLTGYAEPGSVVFVSWESVLLSSAVIADASQGYFEVDVPKKLANGEHKVLTYAYNKPKKMASHYSKVLFRK